MNLYKLTYTQESEAFVSAQSEEEAREYITELTQNGGERMNEVRLNECGWSVTEEWKISLLFQMMSRTNLTDIHTKQKTARLGIPRVDCFGIRGNNGKTIQI